MIMGDSLAFSLSNVMNNPPAKMAKNVNDLDLKIKKYTTITFSMFCMSKQTLGEAVQSLR